MALSTQPLTLDRTVSEMYRLAHEYTKDVRNLHLKSLDEVWQLVRRVPYRRDVEAEECGGAVECLKRPGLTLMLGGDCDDKTILAGAALNLLGVTWRIVTVSFNGDGEMSHTYLEVNLGDGWLPFDPTTGNLPMFAELPFTNKIVW